MTGDVNFAKDLMKDERDCERLGHCKNVANVVDGGVSDGETEGEALGRREGEQEDEKFGPREGTADIISEELSGGVTTEGLA